MKSRSQDIKAEARTHACNYPEKGITSASHIQEHKRVKLKTSNFKSLEFKFKPYEGVE